MSVVKECTELADGLQLAEVNGGSFDVLSRLTEASRKERHEHFDKMILESLDNLEAEVNKSDHQNERPKEAAQHSRCYCCGSVIAGSAYTRWCLESGKPVMCSSSECPGRRPPKEDQ